MKKIDSLIYWLNDNKLDKHASDVSFIKNSGISITTNQESGEEVTEVCPGCLDILENKSLFLEYSDKSIDEICDIVYREHHDSVENGVGKVIKFIQHGAEFDCSFSGRNAKILLNKIGVKLDESETAYIPADQVSSYIQKIIFALNSVSEKDEIESSKSKSINGPTVYEMGLDQEYLEDAFARILELFVYAKKNDLSIVVG